MRMQDLDAVSPRQSKTRSSEDSLIQSSSLCPFLSLRSSFALGNKKGDNPKLQAVAKVLWIKEGELYSEILSGLAATPT
jgi:hypothetical protein